MRLSAQITQDLESNMHHRTAREVTEAFKAVVQVIESRKVLYVTRAASMTVGYKLLQLSIQLLL